MASDAVYIVLKQHRLGHRAEKSTAVGDPAWVKKAGILRCPHDVRFASGHSSAPRCGVSTAGSGLSPAPEVLELGWRQFGIPDRVLDGFVPEVLDGRCIVARIGEGVDFSPSPRRFTRRLTASVVNGPPRSVVNTRGEAG